MPVLVAIAFVFVVGASATLTCRLGRGLAQQAEEQNIPADRISSVDPKRQTCPNRCWFETYLSQELENAALFRW